ncbi:MAG TPA: helicase-related protein, partial [Steroidobacteraceae bacterium]|nr:helicase-related protein [Steroidobacteraceae bacterium]
HKRAPLYVLSTGGGKTVLFTHIAHGAAAKGNRVYILSHRQELIDQISVALDLTGTPHGFIAAGYPTLDAHVQIASVQTLVRRLDRTPQPDLIVIDEAHHARAETFERIIREWPKAKLLGVTATPIRLSGEGLGTIFDHLIVGPSMRELIEGGYLAPYRLFSPPTVDASGLHHRGGEFVTAEAEALMDKPAITGSALEHYRQHADGLPALVFCVSIQHAKSVADQFRDAGYSAFSIDGTMERTVRRGVVEDFRAGRIKVVTSAELANEGVDLPGAHVGIFLRPTQSLGLYLQQIGRILRPCDGKNHALLLDHVGNCYRHGLPDEPREWSLAGDDGEAKRKPGVGVRFCASCFRALPAQAKTCSECGYEFPAKPREIEQREGELAEVTPEMIAKRAERREQGQAQSLEALMEIARRKGYRPEWAQRVLAGRLAKQRRQA